MKGSFLPNTLRIDAAIAASKRLKMTERLLMLLFYGIFTDDVRCTHVLIIVSHTGVFLAARIVDWREASFRPILYSFWKTFSYLYFVGNCIDLDEIWQMDGKPEKSDRVKFSAESLQWFRLAGSKSVWKSLQK